MNDSEDGIIREGFFCPNCHKDFSSGDQLLTHFQQAHSEDQDVLKSLKDIFGKAKKKILKLDDDDINEFSKLNLATNALEAEPQTIGVVTSHIDEFKKIRMKKLEHSTAETNTLIIRLDKLLQLDHSDRKHQEQGVVEWLDGTSVKLCPECAKSFNLTRRQHHCRVCGSIVCSSCSHFLSVSLAKMLTSSAATSELSNEKHSNESIRTCSHCFDLLEKRRRVQFDRNTKPYICSLYELLSESKQKAEPSLNLYKLMLDSLYAGEIKYNLTDAQMLRTNIAREAELIDNISKKISQIPPDPEAPMQESLQAAIRRATLIYIREHLMSLPKLPTPEELNRIRDHRELKRDWVKRQQNIAITSGWTPEVKKTVPRDDDPLMQQMMNIKEYIKQARSALRFEEVATLEEHLEELNKMYSEQQLQNISNDDSFRDFD